MKTLIILFLIFLSSYAVFNHYPERIIVVSEDVWIHKADTLSFVHALKDSTAKYICSFYIPKGDTVLLKQVRTLDMLEYRISKEE